uniref:Uncharacterized protein n=1 Tax=viral metagenome TaxID=1070528 RepID=A0A6M3XH55_9ZZZZ
MSDKEVVRYEKALAEYNITPEKVREMAKEYESLHVVPDDIKSYKAVHAAKMVLTRVRTGVDKRRKELGVDAYAWIKTKDGAAKDLLEPIIPLEDRFKAELSAEDARIEKIETDRVQAIRDKIEEIKNYPIKNINNREASLINALINQLFCLEITPEEYQEFKAEAIQEKEDALALLSQQHADRIKFEQEEAVRKAESERLEKVRKEQEAEAARLKVIADEQEAARKAQEMEARKEREAIEEEKIKIQAEKDKIEATKKTEQDRKAMAAFEKEALEKARIRAEQEAKEEAVRKESARIAKEEAEKAEHIRKTALAPDKVKLIAYVDALYWLDFPALKDDKAKEILNNVRNRLTKIRKGVKDAVGRL